MRSFSSYPYPYDSKSLMTEQTAWVQAMAEHSVGQAVT